MIRNGYQSDGAVGVGDGNGFKTGGSKGKDLAHNGICINTLAAENTHDGYDQNSNRGDVTIYNAIAFANGHNYGLGDGSERMLEKLTVKNSLSLDGKGVDEFRAVTEDMTNNSWRDTGISSSDFKSLNTDELLAERQADGTLPVVSFFNQESGSPLIDAGVDVGFGYRGSAPDLGSFEAES